MSQKFVKTLQWFVIQYAAHQKSSKLGFMDVETVDNAKCLPKNIKR